MATIALTTAAYPLRLFVALRTGLQDYSFLGVLSLAQTLSAVVITVSLTYAGNGLYGVALGPAVPGIAGGVALARTAEMQPGAFSQATGISMGDSEETSSPPGPGSGSARSVGSLRSRATA